MDYDSGYDIGGIGWDLAGKSGYETGNEGWLNPIYFGTGDPREALRNRKTGKMPDFPDLPPELFQQYIDWFNSQTQSGRLSGIDQPVNRPGMTPVMGQQPMQLPEFYWLPNFFKNQPETFNKLSPYALAMMGKLFETNTGEAPTKEYQVKAGVETPWIDYNGYQAGTMSTSGAGLSGGTSSGANVPATSNWNLQPNVVPTGTNPALNPQQSGTYMKGKEMGQTASMMPDMPSAQWVQRARSLGLLPILEQYIKGINEQDYDLFMQQAEAAAPSAQKMRIPEHRIQRM